MINKRSIAVLLAAYNAERYLEEQIESLLVQTNSDWTLYVRNDGSTDDTEHIIEKYCERFPDRIIQVDKGGDNLGCRGCFFRLIEVVESDYYMFCDADDFWLPEKIELSYNLLKEKENKYPNTALLVHTDKVVCDEKLNIIAPSWWRAVGLNPDLFHKLLYIPVSPVVGGATSIFNKITRDYCLPLPQDAPQHDCWIPMQTAKYGQIFALHNPLILYRQHGSNAVGAPTEPYRFNVNKLIQLHYIIKRDFQAAKYYKSIGYGCVSKYFIARIMTFFKLQWSKLTYK